MTTRPDKTLEICTETVESCIEAQAGGAHRIELCSDLSEGGLTPSAGLIAQARRRVSIPLHVMIRPRPGDFICSPEELAIMASDIAGCKQLGADGVVLGCLDPQGNLDRQALEYLLQAARPLAVTFHRAIDVSRRPLEVLQQLIDLGVERVLTSGAQPTAEQGIDLIRQMHELSVGRIVVMAGAGIRPENAARIVERTGVNEIHSTAAHWLEGPAVYRAGHLCFSPSGNDYLRKQTDRNIVKAIIRELEK